MTCVRHRTSAVLLSVAVTCLVAACGVHGASDDGFRARLAAGCHTEQACDDLYTAAFMRSAACNSASGSRNSPTATQRDCTAQRQDMEHAGLLQRRVQEAAARAEATAQQERDERARRAEEEQAAAAAADAIARAKAACAADRDARIAAIRSALTAAHDAQQSNRMRTEYIKVHCRTVLVDGSKVTRCPAHAPAGTLDGDGNMVIDRVPADVGAAALEAIERSDATHCNDLDANNPNAPELAGAYAEPDPQAPSPTPSTTPSGSGAGGGGALRCCDGTLPPSCGCSGSHRGCCSHHQGVCGCVN
jgi:hypothetical protein